MSSPALPSSGPFQLKDTKTPWRRFEDNNDSWPYFHIAAFSTSGLLTKSHSIIQVIELFWPMRFDTVWLWQSRMSISWWTAPCERKTRVRVENLWEGRLTEVPAQDWVLGGPTRTPPAHIQSRHQKWSSSGSHTWAWWWSSPSPATWLPLHAPLHGSPRWTQAPLSGKQREEVSDISEP